MPFIRYINCFDNDRKSLVFVYTTQSAFSMSANTAIPDRARARGGTENSKNSQKMSWQTWLPFSRNLAKIKTSRRQPGE